MSLPSITELQALTIWRNGELVTGGAPQASVWDHGLLYGDGVFEGLRLRDGWLYRPDDHLARLQRSARMLSIETTFTSGELLEAITAVASANRLEDAHVRIVITRGIGLPGLDPRRSPTPSAFVLVYPMPSLQDAEPLRLLTSAIIRKAPRSVPPGAKTLNYVDAILAKLQANEAAADDALMLDQSGAVAEATATNIFCVNQHRLLTPTCTAALPGVTRRTVLELADELSIPNQETPLSLGDLYSSEELFLTGTAAGIAVVGRLDGRLVPSSPGPITAALIQAYKATWNDQRFARQIGP